ncbi:TetR/AcrR family transcriptional regulator [Skermania piniformis]|uniref:TetR/AcrR family transcriptional regulator n=1 Tax=Skermania pinensis TaxID=39122 RepID=A0ABX8S3K0_9ACTN|nr:helix-turn-helix domain-containing protein [Skermania piniformis]QXQ12399.1 TetR/AcrR family transcriptional regulator [Skermania piniformis]
MAEDWLVGADRADRARERLYEIAAELIARDGLDGLDLDELARRAHCSRATLYRHTGGKRRVQEAVLIRASTAVVAGIRDTVAARRGRERARLTISLAVEGIRADPITRQFLRSRNALRQLGLALDTPFVPRLAAELIGLAPDDTVGPEFAIRSILALVLWPPARPELVESLVDAVVAGLRIPTEQS